MATHWPAISAALDTSTALCAGFNALYFLDRLFSLDDRTPARTAAVGVLALISVAMMLEAVSLLALSAVARPAPVGEPGWVLVRALPALASAGVTAMLARRAVGR